MSTGRYAAARRLDRRRWILSLKPGQDDGVSVEISRRPGADYLPRLDHRSLGCRAVCGLGLETFFLFKLLKHNPEFLLLKLVFK